MIPPQTPTSFNFSLIMNHTSKPQILEGSSSPQLNMTFPPSYTHDLPVYMESIIEEPELDNST